MFERILKLGAPNALRRYAGTYEWKQPTDLATITEARQLMDLLRREAQRYRQYGLSMPPMTMLAVDGGGQPAKFVNVQEMIDAGFSEEKPIHILIEVEQGAKRRTDADLGDESIHPAETYGAFHVEVFDTAYAIATDRDRGLRQFFAGMDAAAQRGAEISAQVEKDQPAPEAPAEEPADKPAKKAKA